MMPSRKPCRITSVVKIGWRQWVTTVKKYVPPVVFGLRYSDISYPSVNGAQDAPYELFI